MITLNIARDPRTGEDTIEAPFDGYLLLECPLFNKNNARRLLDRYRDRLCTFNDDIQGTSAVTLAGLLTAVDIKGAKLCDQRIVMLGAGSAATGIADQLVAAMVSEGCAADQARAAIWLVDSHGPVHTGRMDLDPAKHTKRYCQLFFLHTTREPGAYTDLVILDMNRAKQYVAL
jgi:malic enzyme